MTEVVTIEGPYLKTALTAATYHAQDDLVVLLLNNNADPNIIGICRCIWIEVTTNISFEF